MPNDDSGRKITRNQPFREPRYQKASSKPADDGDRAETPGFDPFRIIFDAGASKKAGF